MLRLAHFSRPLRVAIRSLWIAGGVGYALFAVVVLFGDGRISADVIGYYYACFFLVPATLCLLRAALVPGERLAWTLFGVGLLCWSVSEFYYFAVVEKLDDPPFPSLSDALWLSYYAGAVVALLLLMRSRLQNRRGGFWIDAAVGGLAIASVGAALLVEPILASTGGSVAAVMTNMAYPLFDLLVISVVLAVFVMTGWRPGSGWLLFGAVAVVLVVCDTIYLYRSAAGTYQSGTPLNLSWPACMMLIAVAAWQRPVILKATQSHGWPAVALTAAFALVGLGLTIYDHWHPVSDAALILAVLTLVVAFARTAMTIAEMQSLAHRRALDTELILNAAGEGICGLDADGRVTFANPEAAALTGYTRSDLVGRHFHDTVHHSRPDGTHYPSEECPLATCLRDGDVHRDDHAVYWHKDGTSFPVDFTSTPVAGELGPSGAVVVFKDVTARQAAAAALEANQRHTRQILETGHDGFLAMNADGLITDWNARAEAIFGWSAVEARGRSLTTTIVPERFRTQHERGLARYLATGEATILDNRLELSALHRDGHEFPMEITISVTQTESGPSFNAFVQDITERVAAAELLERQRQQLLDAQSVGGFGSWEWDIAENTVEWSDELCRIYGVEPEAHPRSLEQVIAPTHPDDRAMYAAQVQASLGSGAPLCFEFRFVRPDGSVRIAESRGEVITDEHGTPVRMVGTGQDITERYELERAKDEFTSVVSHELRTPLTSIRGSLGLLESGVLGELPEKGQRMVEIAVQNTDRLVRLINDILDIERINSGQIDMRPTSCGSDELIARARESVSALAAAAGVTVIADAEPVRLWADSDRMIQALTNLIGNAVKFSPPGSSVRISCTRQGEEVLFEVADEGRGIPAENLESIFARFGQVDASDSRKSGGTGLGLAICRSIVEQHGGRIWAQSTPGEGATFSLLLPAPLAYDRALTPADAPDGPTVLVCDDDACVIQVVRNVLEDGGYRVIAAQCGEQAVEYAIAMNPDVILLDLLMPGMSGWETAAALKQHPETERTPIVILSVLAQDETNSPDGAVVDWVQKPLDDVQLFAALERAVSTSGEPFKVLVVDDDEDLAGVLTETFERHGIQTFHATDGSEAIEISQQVLPDLLVLDLGLPEVSGFEVVQWLRRHERLHAIPIVVYTGRELDDDDRRRLQLGATTEILTKGRITPMDFETRVVALLRQRTPTELREDDHELQAHPVGR